MGDQNQSGTTEKNKRLESESVSRKTHTSLMTVSSALLSLSKISEMYLIDGKIEEE